jgi:hypothetical protein
MAVERPGTMESYQAAADLSAQQFRFVKLDANGQIAAITAATDIPLGILQDKPSAAGRAGAVMLDGMSKVVAGANLAKADIVGTDNQGRAVAVVAGTDTTKYAVGQVRLDNSVTGGLATIVFDCKAPRRAA